MVIPIISHHWLARFLSYELTDPAEEPSETRATALFTSASRRSARGERGGSRYMARERVEDCLQAPQEPKKLPCPFATRSGVCAPSSPLHFLFRVGGAPRRSAVQAHPHM